MNIATIEIEPGVTFNPEPLDGLQIGPVQIIGAPAWHEQSERRIDRDTQDKE